MKVDPVTARRWSRRFSDARDWAHGHGHFIVAFDEPRGFYTGVARTLIQRRGVLASMQATGVRIWVEEPNPLDFPSETWKQRVMLLA